MGFALSPLFISGVAMLPLRLILPAWLCITIAGTLIWVAQKNPSACSIVPTQVGVLHDDVIYQCSASVEQFNLYSAEHGPGYRQVLVSATGAALTGWAGTKPSTIKAGTWLFPYALDEVATFTGHTSYYVTIHFVKEH